MLRRLSIRDVVLIDRLDLDLAGGLSVLTGETGAGKSILLDCLGLALGGRAEAGLVRGGAAQCSVAAAFEVDPRHPAALLLAEHGLGGDDRAALVLRRVQGGDGRSRAFVNDQPVGVALLRQFGDLLVEIQGQFERERLRDAERHRRALDAYGRLGGEAEAVASRHRALREAEGALGAATAAAARARTEEEALRQSVAELEALDPRPDEEEALAAERRLLQHAERLIQALNEGATEIEGVEPGLRRAARTLGRAAEKAEGRLDPAVGALDRALAELAEAMDKLRALGRLFERDDRRVDTVETRLFALRAAARRHGVAVAELPALSAAQRARLQALDDGGAGLLRLAAAAETARRDYLEAAETLSRRRREAASRLDRAIAAELPPLKLERARFLTACERLPEAEWSGQGLDRIEFRIATLPGLAPGPLDAVASGGELSRLLLALKVALATAGGATTLVFDEADAGIGGATAAAVGDRLARLAKTRQVLAVTHSPQVAARADRHVRVVKRTTAEAAAAELSVLDAGERREEIARMLSGAKVTDEARAAADRLLDGAAA